MPIKKSLERIPGRLMIVPMAAGADVATVAPEAGAFFGFFTGALFRGALPILAAFYVCLEATIPPESLPTVARRGARCSRARSWPA